MPVLFMALAPLGAAALMDWLDRRIPDACVYLVASCGVLRVALNGWPPEDALWGLLVLGGPLLLAMLAAPRYMGGGDIKLCAALGLLLGPERGVFVLLTALCAAALWGRLKKEVSAPLAPALLLGYTATFFL